MGPDGGVVADETIRADPRPCELGSHYPLSQICTWEIVQCVDGIYADDCFFAGPVDTVRSALHSVRALCALPGLEMEPPEEQAPADSVDFLGASIRIGDQKVSASLSGKRKTDYAASLRWALPPTAADARFADSWASRNLLHCGVRPCCDAGLPRPPILNDARPPVAPF